MAGSISWSGTQRPLRNLVLLSIANPIVAIVFLIAVARLRMTRALGRQPSQKLEDLVSTAGVMSVLLVVLWLLTLGQVLRPSETADELQPSGRKMPRGTLEWVLWFLPPATREPIVGDIEECILEKRNSVESSRCGASCLVQAIQVLWGYKTCLLWCVIKATAIFGLVAALAYALLARH